MSEMSSTEIAIEIDKLLARVTWPSIKVGLLVRLSEALGRAGTLDPLMAEVELYLLTLNDVSAEESVYQSFIAGAHVKYIRNKSKIDLPNYPFQLDRYSGPAQKVFLAFNGGLDGVMFKDIYDYINAALEIPELRMPEASSAWSPHEISDEGSRFLGQYANKVLGDNPVIPQPYLPRPTEVDVVWSENYAVEPVITRIARLNVLDDGPLQMIPTFDPSSFIARYIRTGPEGNQFSVYDKLDRKLAIFRHQNEKKANSNL